MGAQASGTGIVDINSELVRKGWVMKGLVQARSTSFWDGLTGMSEDSVIYQKNDFSVKEGHEVHFQMDGNLVSEAHVDKEQAWGNSEQKKLFSDSLRIRRLRWSVDNGDKFDAKNVGDLALAEHSDSRTKLADLFIRAKDQFNFDCLQGRLHNETPTHVLRPNGKTSIATLAATDIMSYNFAMDMEDVVKSGRGYQTGGTRRPLEPYKLADGRKVWLMVINSRQARDLRKDDKFIQITSNADIRGEGNRLIKGVIGTYGAFVVIEAQDFFGVSSSRLIGKTKVEIAGLRKVDEDGNFTGEVGFGASGKIIADRGLILGKGAVQIGFGKMPDYKFKSSQDFDIKSESALEVWMNVQKTILRTEGSDYDDAKVAGFDYGVVVFETYNSTVA
jgi:N4-gp56 family major capsid protein